MNWIIICLIRFYVVTGWRGVVSGILDITPSVKPCRPGGLMDVNVTYHDDKTGSLETFARTFNLSDEGVMTGGCTGNYTSMLLYSDDRTLKFNLVFEILRNKSTENDEFTLLLADVSMFRVDVPSQVTSLKPSKRGRGQTLLTGTTEKNAPSRHETLVFETPVYNSRCRKKHEVTYYSKQAYASLAFSQVRFQPYSDYLSSNPHNVPRYMCPEDATPAPKFNKHGQYLVPVILGLSLTVVISLLVVGYLVHKKVEGLGYSSMD